MSVKVEEINLLGEEIDVYKTCAEAKKFLGRRFQNDLELCSPRRTDLSSPLLDATGVVNHGGVNGIETKIINGINAANEVKATYFAIKSLPNSTEKPYKKILTLKYILNETHPQVMSQVHYRNSQYYRLFRRALCLFATQMEDFKKKYHATEIKSMIIDVDPEVSNVESMGTF